MMKLHLNGKTELSLFGLGKVGRGEKMDIPGERVRLLHVKKIGSSNHNQVLKMQKYLKV